ncbi:MAG TPA: cupin-like domain-containing protein [Telluria sp.]|nr:cupin-like domain-containing protein [Telluria sp.]
MISVPEWRAPDLATFEREVLPHDGPAVLRGVVRHWPAVQAGRAGPEAVAAYIARHDSGALVDAILMPPEARGRVFYTSDMQGFNFLRNRVTVGSVIEQVARYSHFANAPSVAVQSALMRECVPGMLAAHRLPLLDASVEPRIWIGNRVITPAHFDQSHNIACVVSGRRRFTLFPPEQLDNLYIGPLDFAPTPTPISLVDFHAPDFERFPKFRAALETARVVDLEPGDALYIPTLWWHHVESLGVFNVLVNYWWRTPDHPGSRSLESVVTALRQGSR